MEVNVKCNDCGWEGSDTELVCTDEDFESSKPAKEIAFNRCPDCDSTDIEDIETENEIKINNKEEQLYPDCYYINLVTCEKHFIGN